MISHRKPNGREISNSIIRCLDISVFRSGLEGSKVDRSAESIQLSLLEVDDFGQRDFYHHLAIGLFILNMFVNPRSHWVRPEARQVKRL